jgi:hypothetical protein
MVTVKLRRFGFLPLSWWASFFLSAPRRAAISGRLPPVQSGENHAGIIPRQMRTSFASADASGIYHYSFDRQWRL